MSLSRYIDVRCNVCGVMLDDGDWTGEGARANARSVGWHHNARTNRDVCPECWDEGLR